MHTTAETFVTTSKSLQQQVAEAIEDRALPISRIGKGPLKKDAFRCRASAERQRRVGC